MIFQDAHTTINQLVIVVTPSAPAAGLHLVVFAAFVSGTCASHHASARLCTSPPKLPQETLETMIVFNYLGRLAFTAMFLMSALNKFNDFEGTVQVSTVTRVACGLVHHASQPVLSTASRSRQLAWN